MCLISSRHKEQIAFAGDDRLMLFDADGIFLFESNLGPVVFKKDRFQKIIPPQRKIVKTPHEDIRGNGALLEEVIDVKGFRVAKEQISNVIKRLFFHGADPAQLSLTGFFVLHFVHHFLPRSGDGLGSTGFQILVAEPAGESRVSDSFVLSDEQSQRFGFVSGFEAALLTSVIVERVKDSSTSSEQSVSLLHNISC